MIIIAGTIDFEDEEHRDIALDKSRSLQQATRDDEPGCLAYCFAADPCVSNRIQVYELWTTAENLDDHFGLVRMFAIYIFCIIGCIYCKIIPTFFYTVIEVM